MSVWVRCSAHLVEGPLYYPCTTVLYHPYGSYGDPSNPALLLTGCSAEYEAAEADCRSALPHSLASPQEQTPAMFYSLCTMRQPEILQSLAKSDIL